MVSAALLATIAAGCLVAAARLRRASWPIRGPHTAIVVWQALGLAWGFSTIGALLAVGLSPYGQSVVGGLRAVSADLGSSSPAVVAQSLTPLHVVAVLAAVALTLLLFVALVHSFVQVVRTRRRHHALLELVARDDPEVPGAQVLDHPAAAAYCLPGMLRSTVVISAGALRVLDRNELAAVLAHEHAHLRQRHDLVLLPFSSLKRAFPRAAFVSACYQAVALLVEICADDHARRHPSPRVLATALMRFGGREHSAVPAGALAVSDRADHEVVTRVSRLLHPVDALSRAAIAGALAGAATLMTTTVMLWHVPL